MQQLSFLDDQLVDHYRITTDRAVFALTAVNGRVSEAPPLAKWAINVPVEKVLDWYAKKGATIERRQLPGQEPGS